jgi:fibronectin type III domain protein
MAIVPKLIKAALDYSKKLPETLLGDGYAVVKGLTGNANFTSLPVDLALLKSMLDGYAVTIGEARDGGMKAIASRNKQGENIIRMLRQLATYVELNCKDDMDTFLSSGFKPRTTTRVAPQPLAQPTILNLDQGNSGELLVSIQAVRKAKHYELHYGPVGTGGATPASWVTLTLPNARTATVSGLTPGTTYAFQVRAYGALGYTEWSDSAIRMCI